MAQNVFTVTGLSSQRTRFCSVSSSTNKTSSSKQIRKKFCKGLVPYAYLKSANPAARGQHYDREMTLATTLERANHGIWSRGLPCIYCVLVMTGQPRVFHSSSQ